MYEYDDSEDLLSALRDIREQLKKNNQLLAKILESYSTPVYHVDAEKIREGVEEFERRAAGRW